MSAQSRPCCGVPVRAADAAGETDLVSPISQLPNEMLEQILIHLPWPTLLKVQRVCRRWQVVIKSALAQLHVLNLDLTPFRHGHEMTDRSLCSLLQRTPNLRQFISEERTDGCSHRVTDTIGRHCPHLVEIQLSCFNLDERSVRHLTCRCPQLQMVDLRSMRDFTENSLCILLTQLPHLLRLRLDACFLDDGNIRRHAPYHHRSANPPGFKPLKVDNLALLAQCKLPLLRELDVSGVDSLTAELFRHMLTKMPALVTLRLSRLDLASDHCLASVARQLLHLDISYSTIDDHDLGKLAPELEQLRSLVLDSCLDLTPAGLCHVTAVPRLSRLSLSLLPAVDGTVLRAMASMPLTEISLAESVKDPAAFTREDLQKLIVEAERLQVLDLSRVSLLTLDLLRECAEKRVQMADFGTTRDALSCLVVKAGGTAVTKGRSGCMFAIMEDSPPHCPAHCPRLELPAMYVLNLESEPEFIDETEDDLDEYNYSAEVCDPCSCCVSMG